MHVLGHLREGSWSKNRLDREAQQQRNRVYLRKKIELPMGAAAPETAVINVMNHFALRGKVLGFSTSASRVN